MSDHEDSFDPTARGDLVAEKVRAWYEANRESWWDRHRRLADRRGGHADEFILGLIAAVGAAHRKVDEEIRHGVGLK